MGAPAVLQEQPRDAKRIQGYEKSQQNVGQRRRRAEIKGIHRDEQATERDEGEGGEKGRNLQGLLCFK